MVLNEIDPAESKKSGKVNFRKTWMNRINEHVVWIGIYSWTVFLITVDIAGFVFGRKGQFAFTCLTLFFVLFSLLIIWGHRRTGRLQRFPGRDIVINKEVVRALCQNFGWNVVVKTSSYDIANIPTSLLGPYLRRAFVLYDKHDILVSVISYNFFRDPGPDLFPFDTVLARRFGEAFLKN